MTASKPTHARSDNSGSRERQSDSGGVRANPDAQTVLDLLRRNGGRVRRQRLLFGTQLPEGVLDDILVRLEEHGYVAIQPAYSGDRVVLPEFVDAQQRRER